MNGVLLDVLAFGAALSGILVITAKNPVISVLFLISVFLNVAGYLVLLGVAYIGLVYIIVYVGAIAILFLFVIMLMNIRIIELLDTGKEYTQSLPLGTLLGALFFFEVLSLTPTLTGYKGTGFAQLPAAAFNSVNAYLTSDSANGTDSLHSSITNSGENYVLQAYNTSVGGAADLSFTSYQQIQGIGQGLYTYASLWLVIASVILLLSMVGPIILCMTPPTPASAQTH